MLNDEELRTLLGIERKLQADDPLFAVRCARLIPGGTSRWASSGYDVSLVLPALLAVVSTAVLWSRRRREPADARARLRRR